MGFKSGYQDIGMPEESEERNVPNTHPKHLTQQPITSPNRPISVPCRPSKIRDIKKAQKSNKKPYYPPDTRDSQVTPRCLYCHGKNVVKKGQRRKKLGAIQLYLCKDCKRVFSPQTVKGKSLPLKVIFEALSLYHLGYSLNEVSSRLKGRFGLIIKKSTSGNWVKEFRELCTYSRLRGMGLKLFSPNQVLYVVTLYHKQVYRFCYHRAKLQLLIKPSAHQRFGPLKEYLEDIASNCPHELFQGQTRSSKMLAGFSIEQVQIREKSNYAVRLAQLTLQAAPNNRARHATLQRFMLANDSVTVATEVPVYLIPEDVRHMQERLKFDLPFKLEEPLTGHIDFVQIRNNVIHILDYKPGAKGERRALEQLTLYALALSRRTGLRLFDFKCAWFDEKSYFEFYPLHVVYKLKGTQGGMG